MYRYLALVWDPADTEGSRCAAALESLVRADQSWKVAYRNIGLLVVHRPRVRDQVSIHLLSDDVGVVIGSLFRRTRNGESGGSELTFDPRETRCVLKSEGRHLIQHYWGSYVAIVRDPGAPTTLLLRDPTANLACYHARNRRVHAFFSDMGDFCAHLQMPLSFHWPYLATTLVTGHQLTRECGFAEIEDIPGGELVRISPDLDKRSTLWHPADFCAEDGLQDEFRASRELRSAVLNAVHTLAAGHSEILVKLSGGLDSSIVTGCLSQLATSPQVTCLNFYIQNEDGDASDAPLAPGYSAAEIAKLRRVIGSADERQFARSVAGKCGFTLCEIERRARHLDLGKLSNAPHAPRPSNYIFSIDEDDAETECVSKHRATACFTGQAGDTVFYNTQRIIGALDYAYLHRFGPRFFRHVSSAATLSCESIPGVLGKVIKYGLLRGRFPSPFDGAGGPHLLTKDAAAMATSAAFRHPWTDVAPRRLCPGKRNHVGGVVQSVMFYPFVYHREHLAPSIHPLASQPVVETCLRIPTYVLLADGTSRGLARRVFRDLLPIEVVRRKIKGAQIAFWQRVARLNVQFIRESLLDGALVRQGILDRARLNEYLTKEQPFLTVQSYQIMQYLACETWLNQMTRR